MSAGCNCGCCSGPHIATPADTWNAPGRTALQRRIGTYGSFLESMRAELSSNARPGLARLRTRSSSDPAVAFADAWAVVADVLTFYQERLSNEGYLRTATERTSVVDIAGLIGYRPRPGVAATVHLAYTLDDKSEPVDIPAGSKAQNVPGPGDQMQTFETAEPLYARVEWNELRPRQTLPLRLRFVDALTTDRIRLAGAPIELRRGDRLLFVFVDRAAPTRVAHVLRRVAKVTPNFEEQVTEVELQPKARLKTRKGNLPADLISIHDDTIDAIAAGKFTLADAAPFIIFFDEYALGVELDEVRELLGRSVHGDFENLKPLEQRLRDWVDALLAETAPAVIPAANRQPLELVQFLDRPAVRVASSAANLSRNIAELFAERADAAPQLLTHLRPRLTESYYRVWRNLPPPRPQPPAAAPVEHVAYRAVSFDSIHVFRNTTGLFGRRAPMRIVLDHGNIVDNVSMVDFELDPPTGVSLEDPDEGVAIGSYVLVEAPQSGFLSRRFLGVAESVSTRARDSYALQGNSTRITLRQPGTAEPIAWYSGTNANPPSLSVVRTALGHVRSERLEIAAPADPSPVPSPDASNVVELDDLYNGLESGRWLLVTGERSDLRDGDNQPIPGIEGRELMMLAGVQQISPPDEQAHTELTFERGLANQYKRSTVRIFANVAKATHGETHEEPLGNGNAAETLQTFSLKRDPLTYIPAATPEGVVTTLEARVNLVRWYETDTLAAATPADRTYVVRVGDDGTTVLTFGTGEHGARLPTGVSNVRATYRSGIGKPGNVKADTITLLASRPPGVRGVNNPLRSAGGADAEDRDHVRANAPLAVAALDRLVGVRDYADFARTFAGIGHADAQRLSNGVQQLVHVTVAGIDDIPIDDTSDLLHSLSTALRLFGDPTLPIQVAPRELLALVISAGITIDPDYLWDDVADRVRTALVETFSFAKRGLGQSAYASEATAAMQAVTGVVAVDLDVFDAVSERELADLDLLKAKVAQLAGKNPKEPQPRPVVPVARARRAEPVPAPTGAAADGAIAGPRPDALAERRDLLPAQLAFIVPEVPDTVILNRR